MTAVEPIGRRLRPLPVGPRPATTRRHDIDEGTVFLVPAAVPSDALVRHGVASSHGAWPTHWIVARDRAGAPSIRGGRDVPPAVSLAATRCTRALLLGDGPLGVDIETIDRVARNARADDAWLAAEERALLADLPPDERLVELACRWVLREAYGKASGRGLDLPLARLAFTVRSGEVTLPDRVLDGDDGWTFSLHRAGPRIIGIVAARSARQAVGTCG